jgi:hypothetical protein
MVRINVPALTAWWMKMPLREFSIDEVATTRATEGLTLSGIGAPGEMPAIIKSRCSSDEKVLDVAIVGCEVDVARRVADFWLWECLNTCGNMIENSEA